MRYGEIAHLLLALRELLGRRVIARDTHAWQASPLALADHLCIQRPDEHPLPHPRLPERRHPVVRHRRHAPSREGDHQIGSSWQARD